MPDETLPGEPASGTSLREQLEALGLAAGPALGPVFELVARVQSVRQRSRVTRSSLLYALARLHPEIRAAVFVPPEAWPKYVERLGLRSFETGPGGENAEPTVGDQAPAS